jgi:hypothetical protein
LSPEEQEIARLDRDLDESLMSKRYARWQGELEAHYSPAVLTKARRLRRDETAVRQDPEHPLLFTVHGRSRDTYRVQVIEQAGEDGLPFVSCTCANGAAIGGRPLCYHSAAVLMNLIQMESKR